MISAIAFREKTVAREMAISSSLALMTGAIAAIALPPQMAVPNEINDRVLSGTRNALPMIVPSKIVVLIEKNVSNNELLPISITSTKLTPKPSPTTATFKNTLLVLAVNRAKGFPNSKLKSVPVIKAIGGDTKGRAVRVNRITIVDMLILRLNCSVMGSLLSVSWLEYLLGKLTNLIYK